MSQEIPWRDDGADGPEDEIDSDDDEEEMYRSRASAYASLQPKSLHNISRCVDACVVNDDLTDGPMRWHTVEGRCVAQCVPLGLSS